MDLVQDKNLMLLVHRPRKLYFRYEYLTVQLGLRCAPSNDRATEKRLTVQEIVQVQIVSKYSKLNY